MGKSNWFASHIKDNFVRKSKKDGFRARSAYKLIQIQEKYSIINKNSIILDCGASPGSWTQVASNIVTSGRILSVDLLPIQPFNAPNICKNIDILQMDMTNTELFQPYLESFLNGEFLDLLISDMAPNMSGIRHIDSIKSIYLSTIAMQYAIKYLKSSNGVFLTKILTGGSEQEFIHKIKATFETVDLIKPPASKSQSSELYILARNIK